jgi:hypothetical protein
MGRRNTFELEVLQWPVRRQQREGTGWSALGDHEISVGSFG